MKTTVLALSLALGMTSTAICADASQKQASNAIHAAVSANNKVAAIGFEWRDTYTKLLGPAKQAYANGDYDKAVKLANTAESHAQLGLAQAEMAKNPHTL